MDVLPYLQNPEEVLELKDGREWLDGDFHIHADYSLDYISESEAWKYIAKITEMARKLYDNWEDYATYYLLGGAMWRGADAGNCCRLARGYENKTFELKAQIIYNQKYMSLRNPQWHKERE